MSLGAVLLFALTATSCASSYFYGVAVARNEKKFLSKSKDIGRTENQDASAKESEPWIASQPYETVSITARDGLKLVGYWLPAPKDSKSTVILAHGYTSMGLDMSVFAEFYSKELGFNVLMPDARGHGRSGGDYIGFGWPERIDYLDWIQWVLNREGDDSDIVLHGVSMGGATVMMVSGEKLPQNVRAIVEDCGYTTVSDELTYQLKRTYNIDNPRIIRDTSALTKKRAGYSFEEASAIAQVGKSVTPILFIHGDADTFVPFEMVSRLYAACSSEKELFIVPGAGHGAACAVDPAGYKSHVSNFIAKHVGHGETVASGVK